MMQPTLAARVSIATSLLFLIAIAAIGIASLESFRAELESVTIAEQNALVERIADNVDQKLLSLQRTLRLSAGEVTEADLASFDAAQRYLDANTGLFASVDRSVFLYSNKGILLAERPFRPGRRGDDVSWRSYIRDTIRLQQPVISEPFMTNVGDGNMVLVATMPVISADGRFIGIVTGSLGLTNPGMLGNVAKTTIGKTGYVFVAASDGKLVMHPDRKRLSLPAFPPGVNALFDRALRGFEGTEQSFDPAGNSALISYKRVPTANWLVAAVYPIDEALSPVREMVWRSAVSLLIACLIVVGVLGMMIRLLMRPLVRLTRHFSNYTATDAMIEPVDAAGGSGEFRALTSAFNRLTARLRERETALVETMHGYQLITENSTDLITKHTVAGTITYASPVSQTTLGVDHDVLNNHSIFEFVHPEDCSLVRAALADAVQRKAVPTVVYRMRHADQHYLWLETTLRLMHGTGGEDTAEILCISRNVSERKRMEERLHDLARTDHLTLLPNRFLLEERFAAGLEQARRERLLLAVLMIDIDRFKNINDTLGHGMGDALLRLAAAKLNACTRECDTLARWGGDEFVLLLPALSDPKTADIIADRCLAALKEPFALDGQVLHVSASIGIVMADDNAEAEVLLKHADTAMYRAKSRGGDCCVVYTPEMSDGARSRLSLENALFHAIDREELHLHYQPLISARTGRLAGDEALVRWQHPDHGLVSPAEFIPIAEETGLIGRIGDWVLRTAARQMDAWYRRGLPRIPLSVNVSSRQFRQGTLARAINSVLDDTGFDPKLLELELTESLLMEDVGPSKAILSELKALGVSIALDDFGTGYSSLSYLKGFDLDTLKIDRAFTAELMTSEASRSIVRATMGLAKGLHLRTIAEGVETRAQADFLVKEGCDWLQGYLFARPLPPAAFLSYALASPTYLLMRPAHEENERVG
jgi:diguanylate cyclase (GGDEF)-like protein/PAS domain S-box-containing protein